MCLTVLPPWRPKEADRDQAGFADSRSLQACFHRTQFYNQWTRLYKSHLTLRASHFLARRVRFTWKYGGNEHNSNSVQQQRCDQRLCKGGSMAASNCSIVWGNGQSQNSAEHHQLQHDHQCLWKGGWVAAGVGFIWSHVHGSHQCRCHNLQCGHQCLWVGQPMDKGTKSIGRHATGTNMSKRHHL